MHIHKTYSRLSDCDFFDTSSNLAVEYLTEIHHLLTHSFRKLLILMDFNFMVTPLDVIKQMGISK